MSDKRLIAVVGPTGSGKTDAGICLAEHFGAPVLSTDSRQMYRGMAIGTAQPSEEQQRRVRHYFIASHDITQNLSCGAYETQALEVLDGIFRRHDYAVAVGGSGLYVRALCEGLDDLPAADAALRAELAARAEAEGVAALAEELRRRDPAYYLAVDRSNPARVIRALEVCIRTGRPYSEFRTGTRRQRDFGIVKIGIDLPRGLLYERIDRRVDRMVEQGLEAEARALYPHRALNALQTVGYKEFFDYFDGRTTRAEAIERIKRNSRHYAKRQLTWFRRDPEIRWFAPDRTDEMIRYAAFGGS